MHLYYTYICVSRDFRAILYVKSIALYYIKNGRVTTIATELRYTLGKTYRYCLMVHVSNPPTQYPYVDIYMSIYGASISVSYPYNPIYVH